MSSQLFVSLPSSSEVDQCIIFGKNAVGLKGVVHDVVYLPATVHDVGSLVKVIMARFSGCDL